jgi:hypothetical protein
LSTTTVVISPARWSASPPFTSAPSWAARPVATMTAVGTARPMAQGHAMMSTDTAAAMPRTKAPSPPTSHHTISVTSAMPITTGTNTALTRSASCWIGAREAWASRIRRTICDSMPSRPSVVAR